jgi:hypothetical protein
MKKIVSVLKYLFFLGLGFFLVWWQFDKMSVTQREQFGTSLQNANYWLIIPVVVMAILSHISRAVRWKILIEPMGYKPSTSNTFYAVMTGYLANTFVPRAGEIIKCSLLGKYEKIPANKLIGTIIVERAFDFICYLIFIAITIVIQVNYVSTFVKEKLTEIAANKQSFPLWGKAMVLIFIIILLIIFIKWMFKKYEHHRHIKTFKGFHLGFKEGFTAIARLKNKGWFLFHTIFIWSMYLLQIYVGFSALQPTEHLGIAEACSVLSLATLGMIVSPGGIGAFPLAVQEVLLIYNVDNVSLGWLIWGVSTGIILIGGLLSFGILVYKNRRKNETKSANITENL